MVNGMTLAMPRRPVEFGIIRRVSESQIPISSKSCIATFQRKGSHFVSRSSKQGTHGGSIPPVQDRFHRSTLGPLGVLYPLEDPRAPISSSGNFPRRNFVVCQVVPEIVDAMIKLKFVCTQP